MTSGVIKSVQQVSINIGAAALTATATITAVVVANSIIIYQGVDAAVNSQAAYERAIARLAITNTTTITATRGDSTNSTTVNAVIVEFASGVNSIQAGTIAISTVQTSNTATISAVGANAFVLHVGASTITAATACGGAATAVQLTNATTVTATVGVAGAALTVGFMVVDLDNTVLASAPQPISHTDASSAATYTDAITPVSLNNSVVFHNGHVAAVSETFNIMYHAVQLSDASHVTYTRGAAGTTGRTIYATVVEFKGTVLKSAVQRGVIALAAATSGTGTISSVTTTMAFCNYNGCYGANGNVSIVLANLTLTNGTTVTGTVSSAGSPNVAYEVIEFLATLNAITYAPTIHRSPKHSGPGYKLQ